MIRQAWIGAHADVSQKRQCVLAGVSRTTVYVKRKPLVYAPRYWSLDLNLPQARLGDLNRQSKAMSRGLEPLHELPALSLNRFETTESGTRVGIDLFRITAGFHDLLLTKQEKLFMNPITLIRESRPELQLNATPWKRIDNTNPSTVTIITSKSPDGRKITGTWICTPGKWEIDYDKWEYCHFQEGYSIITPEGHQPIHVKAGDIFTIEPGTKGTWEVIETVRKYFIFVS